MCNIHTHSLILSGESSKLRRQNDSFARMKESCFPGFRGNL